MNIKPNVGACKHCGHDHFNRECGTCHDADGPCRAMLQWEVKVLGASLRDAINNRPAEPPPASLEQENSRLNEKLQAFTRTAWEAQDKLEALRQDNRNLYTENARLTKLAWEAQAQVARLLKQVKDLEARNDELSRDAGTLIGARALNEALTQKQHKLEAENARYFEVIEGVAGQLEKLGFGFGPGKDICDND